MEQKYDTNWIWTPNWTYEDDLIPSFVYFRKEFILSKLPEEGAIEISADSRYKLYVNDSFIQAGPSKGDRETWYYDEADITPFLKEGKNVIGIEVLRYPEELSKRNFSLYRGQFPGLYIEGILKSKEEEVDLSGKSGFKCYKVDHIKIVGENVNPAPLHISEVVEGDSILHGWKRRDYDETNWLDSKPRSFFEVDKGVSPGNLEKRTIPYQRQADRSFENVVCVRESSQLEDEEKIKDNWEGFLKGKDIVIPANTKETVEIDAGELMTGFILLTVAAGTGTKITLHCAESYSYENTGEDPMVRVPLKGDRTDYIDGRLRGFEDKYIVGGFGTDALAETYEPYWFRTFRFIGVTIETKEEALTLKGFSYRETGYPLEVKSHVSTSDESLAPIWDISERTLRRCMHETYMDCPFYEQLQYSMIQEVKFFILTQQQQMTVWQEDVWMTLDALQEVMAL